MSIIYGNMVGGASGTDGKSAYQYAVEGGYTGTEAEFARKLASELLIVTITDNNGTLSADKSLIEIVNTIYAGIPVLVDYGGTALPLIGIADGNLFFGTIMCDNDGTNAFVGTLIIEITSNGEVNDVSAQVDSMPNPNALTFTGAVTGSYDGSAALSVEIPSGGGGDNPLRLIKTVTLAETVKSITVDTDDDGSAFSLSEIYIMTNATNSEGQTEATSIGLDINGKALSLVGTTAQMNFVCGKTGESGRNWLWLMSLNPLRVLHGTWVAANISSGKTVQCWQTNEFNATNPNPYSVGEKITSIKIYGVTSKHYLAAGSQFRIYGR